MTIKLNENKLKLSPRFIHFDEWQLLHLQEYLHEKKFPLWQKESLEKYKEYSHWDDEKFPVSFKPETEKPNLSTLKIGKKQTTKICVGIANFKLNEKDIEHAIREDKSPNLSLDRQIELYRMLNDAERNKVDLLVMPELAIPVSWLPFMVARARRNEIGLVFGLEHWVVDGVAYNLIIEALPFKNGKYKSCVMTARIKNHYAPSEQDMLESLRISEPKKPSGYSYHKVQWNGLAFATYNCFELADITHRALFKSELDLLIACVWNKDIHYYEHILEATVRDLHCYVVQSNTSQYGGSCVLQPSKTETKTMLYVKGGKNACILTIDLDIQALRDFQFKSTGKEKDRFKTLPPGYVCEEVLKRSG